MVRIEIGLASARRRPVALISIVVLATLLMGLGASAANAGFRHVKAGGSDVANDCVDQYAPCATIQHAIDEAEPWDRISVGPGTYEEQLVIDVPVTLRGPDTSWPVEHPRENEAVIDGGAGTAISPQANDIAVEGFTIEASGAGIPVRTAGADLDRLAVHMNIIKGDVGGVRLEAGGERNSVSYNVIEAEDYRIRLDGDHHADLRIRWNRLTGPPGSYGVLADSGPEVDGFTLEGNEFESASIAASITNGSVWGNTIEPAAGDVGFRIAVRGETQIMENTFRGNGEASCLRLLRDPGGSSSSFGTSIAGNEFASCTPYALQLGPEVEDISITANTFPNSYDGVTTDNSTPWDVNGRGISVWGNRMIGIVRHGVHNAVAGTLDATDNWWGCNAGPGAPGCGSVSAGVDAWPSVRLTAEASEDSEKAWLAPVKALDPGGEAVLIAYLKNGDGGEALNVPTKGIAAGFSSLRGTLLPSSAIWQNARALSGFTAGQVPGPAGIMVTMDNQQVEVPLRITGELPPTALPAAPDAPSPPEPPRIRIPGGPLKLSTRNVVVGAVSCARSLCRVGQKSARVEVGERQFGARLRVPASIEAEGLGRIQATLPRRAFGQLSRHGTGVLVVTVEVTGADGGAASMNRRIKVQPTLSAGRHGP